MRKSETERVSLGLSLTTSERGTRTEEVDWFWTTRGTWGRTVCYWGRDPGHSYYVNTKRLGEDRGETNVD